MKTIITIEIDTEFKVLKDNETNEDITKDVEKEFHDSIFGMIDEFLQRDDFEDKWINYLERTEGDYEYIPQEDNVDFSDMGKIMIKVTNK